VGEIRARGRAVLTVTGNQRARLGQILRMRTGRDQRSNSMELDDQSDQVNDADAILIDVKIAREDIFQKNNFPRRTDVQQSRFGDAEKIFRGSTHFVFYVENARGICSCALAMCGRRR